MPKQFCLAVEATLVGDRTECLVEVYRLLPQLLTEAVQLPEVSLSNTTPVRSARAPSERRKELESLYAPLKKKLADWDGYHQVFDPTTEKEAIFGSLADDLADIRKDLREGLHLLDHPRSPLKAVWHWRILFYSHWGKHAIDAFSVLHARFSQTLFF